MLADTTHQQKRTTVLSPQQQHRTTQQLQEKKNNPKNASGGSSSAGGSGSHLPPLPPSPPPQKKLSLYARWFQKLNSVQRDPVMQSIVQRMQQQAKGKNRISEAKEDLDYLISHAPLLLLRVIAILLSTRTGVSMVISSHCIRWGLDSGKMEDYEDPSGRPTVPVAPIRFLKQLADVCFEDMVKGSVSPWWYLRNLCIIAGWGAREGIVPPLQTGYLKSLLFKISGVCPPSQKTLVKKNQESIYFLVKSEEANIGDGASEWSYLWGPGEGAETASFSDHTVTDSVATEGAEGDEMGLLRKMQLRLAFLLTSDITQPLIPTKHLQALLGALPALARDLPIQSVEEVERSVAYLLSDQIPQEEIRKSSRWFRLSPNMNTLRHLDSVGFDSFLAASTEPLEPILVAAHIKSVIRQVKEGVVSEAVRKGLVETIMPEGVSTRRHYINHAMLATSRSLLSLTPNRLRIIKSLAKLATLILTRCEVDPIQSVALARVVPVEGGGGGYVTSFDEVRELERWQTVWGMLLRNSNTFFQPDETFDAEAHDFSCVLNRLDAMSK